MNLGLSGKGQCLSSGSCSDASKAATNGSLSHVNTAQPACLPLTRRYSAAIMRLTLLICAFFFALTNFGQSGSQVTFTRSGANATLEYSAGANSEFMLEAATNLPAWNPVVSMLLTNGLLSWREAVGTNANRFYRVRSVDPSETRDADDFRLIDHTGKSRNLFYYQPDTNFQAFVIIFAQGNYASFASKITAIKNTTRFQNKVLFFTIESDTNATRASISNQVVAAGMTWPVMQDPMQIVTRSYDPHFNGEVFVVTRRDLKIPYRGLIDDGTNTFLVNALDRIFATNRVVITRAEPRQNPIIRLARNVPDYSTVIAPLLQRRCAVCHSPGNIGPFAMTQYEDLIEHAQHMKEMVMTGMMPPFHADPLFGKWQNDISLTGQEKAQLVDWIDAGIPRGSGPDILTNIPPPAPKWPVELGPPDEIVTVPPQSVRAIGTEAYRYVYANATNATPRWLRAAVVRPSNTGVVHHYIVWQGHSNFAQLTGIAFYVPGHNDRPFPPGTGMQIPANAPLTFNLHYTANGEAAIDQPELGLWYSDTPPPRVMQMASPLNYFFSIPPGSSDVDVVASQNFGQAATIYSFSPHMHLRGLRMRFELTLPGVPGKQVLLSVPKYDFDWQTVYTLETPLEIPANSTITVTGAFDNSRLNLFNPDPTKTISWGEQSWDEMFIGYIEYANH
jgi:hypothetical protein